MPRIQDIQPQPNVQAPSIRPLQTEALQTGTLQTQANQVSNPLRDTPLRNTPLVPIGAAAVNARRAGPEDFGYTPPDASNSDRSVQRLADFLNSVADTTYANSRKAKLAGSVTDAQQELQTYSTTLMKGWKQQDGSIVPPADPDQSIPLYAKKVKEIQEKYQESLGDQYGAFNGQFSAFAFDHGLKVQDDAIGRSREQSNMRLDETIDKAAQNAAFADDAGRPKIVANAEYAIAAAMQGGQLSPEAGAKKFHELNQKVERAELTKGLREDPETLLTHLTDPNVVLNGIDPNERQQWITSTTNEIERQHSGQVSLAKQEADLLEKQNELKANAAIKDLNDLEAKGKYAEMAPIIEKYRDAFTAEQHGTWLRKAARRPTQELFVHGQALAGQDVGPTLNNLVQGGLMDVDRAKSELDTSYSARAKDPRADIELNSAEATGSLDQKFIDKLRLDGRIDRGTYDKWSDRARKLSESPVDPVESNGKAVFGIIGKNGLDIDVASKAVQARNIYDAQIDAFSREKKRAPTFGEAADVAGRIIRSYNKDNQILPDDFEGNPANPDPAEVEAWTKNILSRRNYYKPDAFERQISLMRPIKLLAKARMDDKRGSQ